MLSVVESFRISATISVFFAEDFVVLLSLTTPTAVQFLD
jgi:hypothetical protein